MSYFILKTEDSRGSNGGIGVYNGLEKEESCCKLWPTVCFFYRVLRVDGGKVDKFKNSKV